MDIRTIPLKEGISLNLFNRDGEIIFESSGKWLYPLFEVEDYLHAAALDASEIFLHDRIAGRAAASLIAGMGFRKCFIDTISSPALEVFEKYRIECGYGLLVDRIDCRTENLISADMDLDHVYRMLRQRAGRLHGLDLEIRELVAGYGDRRVLNGLNLKLRAGDQIIITGGNGTGKSTLLKTLIGLVEPSDGEIILGGMSSGQLKKTPSPVGYVNQSINHGEVPVTAADVVSLGLLGQNLSAADSTYQIEVSMRRTGCFELASRAIDTLSGGEKQRVSLARCLAQKAGLILMDEPASFLDRESREDFLDLLNKIARGTMPTIILFSHDRDWLGSLGWPVRTLKDGRLC